MESSPQVGEGYTTSKPVQINSQNEFIARSIEEAITGVTERGAQVVFMQQSAAFQKAFHQTRFDPIANYAHLLQPETATKRAQLIAEFNRCVKSGDSKGAQKAMKALSEFAPGLSGCEMINQYTTKIHHAAHQDLHKLFEILYGPNYHYLHNRMAVRFTPAAEHGPLKIADAKLHKEGFPGDIGYIVCAPFKGKKGQRCFTFVPNEQKNPLDPPGKKLFRPIRDSELIDPDAHQVVSLEIEIPEDYMAIIIFNHYNAHGVDPRGEGIQLYISACNDSKLAKLDEARRKMLQKKTHMDKHAPELRDPRLTYSDTVIIALLMGICDQFWPSGKVIYAHGAHQQSLKHNKRKFKNEKVQFALPVDGQVPSLSKRRRMEANGFRLPEMAWNLAWRVDPEDPAQVPQPKRWGLIAADAVSCAAPSELETGSSIDNPIVID